jgi:uncharacterized protein (DUF302 family)
MSDSRTSSEQTIGIDLPLKVLVWQDASRATWLSYNDPAWLTHRHGVGEKAKRYTLLGWTKPAQLYNCAK